MNDKKFMVLLGAEIPAKSVKQAQWKAIQLAKRNKIYLEIVDLFEKENA